ncbi:uncharacterized protein LOC115779508 [Archocentrus centrarchus]|nr:uncharacterized protein LOC115779508 [Archocentrus centrarchus]
MARRELISTGLVQFNDRPECFRAWKASFMNSIRDLSLSASEQLDLLVKWLGKDSSEHARRIRTVHVNHPEHGLRAVWNRLNEYYGAPEVIENSLFKRLESFPKVQNKNELKLRELGDLLMEIQAAKADGDLFGLSYLDTPRGINPIVQKLPFYLQEKWLTLGFNYKEQHRVTYPPFSFFVNFVCLQARMRNDPGFMLAASSNEQSGYHKPASKLESQRAVAVLKTGVSPDTSLTPSDSPSASKSTSREDPAKRCLLHNKPHPLHKCRGFRDKPIEERKALLKKHGVCYKCCKTILPENMCGNNRD